MRGSPPLAHVLARLRRVSIIVTALALAFGVVPAVTAFADPPHVTDPAPPSTAADAQDAWVAAE